jgi:hypothetical protein
LGLALQLQCRQKKKPIPAMMAGTGLRKDATFLAAGEN